MPAKPPARKAKKTAKKTVQKRTTATDAKKPTKPAAKATGAKSASKKKPAAKKTAKKSTTSTRKRGTKTELIPRSADKKSSDKTVALEQLFKKPSEQEFSLPEIQKTDSAGINIRLPGTMSLRSIAKAKAISNLFADAAIERVRKVAYVSSFAFILVGGFYALNGAGVSFGKMAAALPLATNTSGSTTSTLPAPDIIERPIFKVLKEVPAEILTEFTGDFTITNVEKVEVRLFQDGSTKPLLLNAEQVTDDTYRYIIPGATLDTGRYTIRVASEGKGKLGEYLFTIGNFVVKEIEDEVEESAATTTINSTETRIEDKPLEEEDDDMPAESDQAEDEAIATTSTAKVTPGIINSFDVYLSQTTFSEATVVYMGAPKEASNIEIYLRPEGSYNNLFVTAAEQVFNTWRFTLDTANIPAGTYELFARGVYQGVFVESKPKLIHIEQIAPALPTIKQSEVTNNQTDQEDLSDADKDTSTTSNKTASPSVPPREFSELSLAPEPQQARNDEPEKITTELLRKRKDNLEVLLRNYSAAAQAGDKTMLRLAKEELDQEIVAISTEEEITDNIEKNVVNRIASLRDRIDTFEELRRNANDGITALDTDKDGVADFDEQALYQTDPENPDSDADGVLDGVEIMRGFNPKDVTNETILAYESPKDVIGLTRADVLSITEVTPVVETDDSLGKPQVQSRISGTALPNSYVTLYIYSTPTIVTVKTDDTGAFVYLFEKQLEDGAHEVYVAITDNTGNVIAHSEPFAFVKEAEAFTNAADAAAGPITTTPESNRSPYAAALGLGVLALGLVLLMLGIGLRTPTKQEANLEAVT